MSTDPHPAPADAPKPAPAAPDDPAAVAGEVSLRLEQWYQVHRLTLPPETQAQFVQMGIEAVARHPERPRGEVLDELMAELDQRLGHIVDDAADRRGAPGADATGARRGWLHRLFWRR